MTMEKLGFGIVGVGLGAKIHALQLRELDEAELVAVYGRNEERAKGFADTYGPKRWYSDYRRMLDDRDVDIVIIITPNGLHKEFAVQAAEAGKHVLVEKPIEISLERANAIIDACRDNDVMLSVIYQLRFGEAVNRIKRAIDSGVFGKILLCDVYDKEYREPSYYADDRWQGVMELAGGGSLTSQSTHVIDLMQWLFGPVASVFAKKTTAVHRVEVEDLVVALATFRSGAFGVVESATCTYPAFKSRIELHGELGSAIVNPEYDELVLWSVRGSNENSATPPDFQFTDVSDPHELPFIRHRYQLQDVIGAIKEERQPTVTGEEALKALRIKLAIYESAAQGREIEVDA